MTFFYCHWFRIVDYVNGSTTGSAISSQVAAPSVPASEASSTAQGRFHTKLPKEPKEVFITTFDSEIIWFARVDKENERDDFSATLNNIIGDCAPLKNDEIDRGTACLAMSTSKFCFVGLES